MGDQRETKTALKHEFIYQVYTRILESYPLEIRAEIRKSTIYDQVADEVLCSASHVRQVVCSVIKNREHIR